VGISWHASGSRCHENSVRALHNRLRKHGADTAQRASTKALKSSYGSTHSTVKILYDRDVHVIRPRQRITLCPGL